MSRVKDLIHTVAEIAQVLRRHKIGAVVILRDEKIVGILSERDIVWRVVCEGLSPKKVNAREIMTKNVITADIHDGLNKIHEIMCSVPFRHLPIVRNGKLIGIVSSRNLIGSLAPK